MRVTVALSAVVMAAGVLMFVVAAPWCPPAGAVSDAGGALERSTRGTGDAPGGAGSAGGEPVGGRMPDRPRYRPPVARPVADPFRPPTNPYGPGNRGLEYATESGDVIRVIGPGIVAFAGWVAGRGVVSIEHPDGLRSSLTGLASISLRRGQLVDTGTLAGTAAGRVHLGVRRAGRYLDPATLFTDGWRPHHAVLVPVPND